MGFWLRLLDSAHEKLVVDKDQRARDEEFVRNHKGSKAICDYFVALFEKGNSGYNWVKRNKTGLFPVIKQDSVVLCYTQSGDGKSFSGMFTKEVEVATYTFQEMYDWYGLDSEEGYQMLHSRTQLDTLEQMINSAVTKLPHIKYSGGYYVRMFQ